MFKRFLSLLLLFALMSTGVVFAENDISPWAEKEVAEAIQFGFVPEEMQTGYQENITRAEFAKISVLFVAHKFKMPFEEAMQNYLDIHIDGETGNPIEFRDDSFTDIDDSPHALYIKWADTLRIVEGRGEGIFDPEAPITREEAATMLLRVYFCYGAGVKLGPRSEGVDNFSDVSEISSWADTAVRYMYQWDVMKGFSEEIYSPKTGYTREQCFLTFVRLDQVYAIIA